MQNSEHRPLHVGTILYARTSSYTDIRSRFRLTDWVQRIGRDIAELMYLTGEAFFAYYNGVRFYQFHIIRAKSVSSLYFVVWKSDTN